MKLKLNIVLILVFLVATASLAFSSFFKGKAKDLKKSDALGPNLLQTVPDGPLNSIISGLSLSGFANFGSTDTAANRFYKHHYRSEFLHNGFLIPLSRHWTPKTIENFQGSKTKFDAHKRIYEDHQQVSVGAILSAVYANPSVSAITATENLLRLLSANEPYNLELYKALVIRPADLIRLAYYVQHIPWEQSKHLRYRLSDLAMNHARAFRDGIGVDKFWTPVLVNWFLSYTHRPFAPIIYLTGDDISALWCSVFFDILGGQDLDFYIGFLNRVSQTLMNFEVLRREHWHPAIPLPILLKNRSQPPSTAERQPFDFDSGRDACMQRRPSLGAIVAGAAAYFHQKSKHGDEPKKKRQPPLKIFSEIYQSMVMSKINHSGIDAAELWWVLLTDYIQCFRVKELYGEIVRIMYPEAMDMHPDGKLSEYFQAAEHGGVLGWKTQLWIVTSLINIGKYDVAADVMGTLKIMRFLPDSILQRYVKIEHNLAKLQKGGGKRILKNMLPLLNVQ